MRFISASEPGRGPLVVMASLACAVLALANLPATDLPLGWLLAFTVPGALLGLLLQLGPRPWQRALLAICLQSGACYLALVLVGPMTRPAALACTILPPLAFATVRQREADSVDGFFAANSKRREDEGRKE